MNLDNLTISEYGALFPIILAEPNPAWPEIFAQEKKLIEHSIEPKIVIRVEHFGSTAVPGLLAKPTIDILLEINDAPLSSHAVRSALENIGYRYIRKPENPPPHMMFVKGYTEYGFQGQAYHIHVRYRDDWDELVFRDYLKAHPAIAQEYAQLKQKLAVEYKNDREQYTSGKTEFIKREIKPARQELLKNCAKHV
ncbi:MAG: GrpB family protein [Bacteroidota bacterium]